MRRRPLAIALCAALLVSAIGFAALACTTTEDVVRGLAELWPGSKVERVDGAEAEAVRDGVAQVTGGALAPGGIFALVDVPDTELTYVVRFVDGCATHHGRFPRSLVRGWIAGLAAEE